MKKSHPYNYFSEEVRMIMSDSWTCWECGMNTADCLHHIVGRGKADGCEKSILNSASLCNQKCHLPNHGLLTTNAGKKKLLNQTRNYLKKIGYPFKGIDKEFFKKYKHWY